jgi:hypothetical protein
MRAAGAEGRSTTTTFSSRVARRALCAVHVIVHRFYVSGATGGNQANTEAGATSVG